MNRGLAGLGAVLAVCAVAAAACGGHTASATIDPSAVPSTASLAKVQIPSGDWTGFDYDAQRSGVGPAATGLSSHNVGALRLRKVKLPGTVDSSAIELHGVTVRGRTHDAVFVTTTYGRTLAIDPGSGRILWEFTPRGIRSYEGSSQITTAGPIADPDRNFIYAASPDGRIHKLSVSDGREAGGWPVSVTRDATHEKIASALNISGGSVVVTTGGYIGDAPPYQGHVVLIDRASGRVTAVWNSLCSDRHELIVPRTCGASDSAIWSREGAVIEPGTGRILVATGNAPFNGSTDWGDSVLELSPDGGQLLQNWTPTNQAQLNSNDTDLGSTAPAILPQTGTHPPRRLAVQGGKAGVLDLLDLDRLNGAGGASGRLGGQVDEIQSPGGDQVFTAPAVWSHGGRTWIFVGDGSGTWAYVLGGSSAHPKLQVAWRSGSGGTSPVIAGGLLYVYDPGGSLNIYLPARGHRLASLPAGSGHWNSPIVIGGRVIVPVGNSNDHATSGTLDIFHLPHH